MLDIAFCLFTDRGPELIQFEKQSFLDTDQMRQQLALGQSSVKTLIDQTDRSINDINKQVNKK